MKKRDKGLLAVAGGVAIVGGALLTIFDLSSRVDGLVITEAEAQEVHDEMVEDSKAQAVKQATTQADFNAYFLEKAVDTEIEILELKISAEHHEEDAEQLKEDLKRKRSFRAQIEEQKQLEMTQVEEPPDE